jgi:sialate O-acetylesterase
MTPLIREAQLQALPLIQPAAMVVTIDIGDAKDIHPTRKEPVGQRLALAARALAYGEKVDYQGPDMLSLRVEGRVAKLKFAHTGTGLQARDGELRGFVIAGADQQFHAATASIVKDEVHVEATDVEVPVAVRYGWNDVADGNLFNSHGLPASPFRTDRW